MDGLPALDLWDIVNEVQRSTNNTVQSKRTSILEAGATLHSKTKTPNVKRRQKVEQLNGVDYVPTGTHSSQNESQLYILEDNEAVIRIMIKGRSPTMRHVSKTAELLLIGCLTGSIWNPRSKSNLLTPKTNSQTARRMGSPRQVCNRRRRTREGRPEPACVQTPLSTGVAHAGEVKGELSSCPWYRLVGVAKTSSETQRRVDRAARKCEWSPRGTGTTALTYPCPSQPCFGGSKGCAQVTGKAGDNGQNSGDGAARSSWTRPSAPGCGDTLKALASYGSIQGGHQSNLAPGSLSTGSPAGRDSSATKARRRLTVPGLRKDSKAVLVRAWLSVTVGTEKVSAGSGGARVMARGQYQQCAHGWKGGRTLVHVERTGEPVRSPKITSVPVNQQLFQVHVPC